jgi:flagellar protein FlaG
MQIGPMSFSPVGQQESHYEKIALRHAVTRTEDNLTYWPWNQDSEDKDPIDIETTARDLEHVSNTFNRRLKFVIDHETKEVIVKVIDAETDKVIKVLPPEELQKMHQRIEETFGFLFDQRV